MVKNEGGKRTKGAARKLLTIKPSSKLRLSECEEEKYAYVTKICGGRICHIKTICGTDLICHIRGKFSGRNKSANFISIGCLLLVGLRDFGKNECDVIEVYTTNEVELLKQMPGVDLSDMHKYTNSFRISGITASADAPETQDDLSDVFEFHRERIVTPEENIKAIIEEDTFDIATTEICIDDI